jgi:opacity protein-like surface antigen
MAATMPQDWRKELQMRSRVIVLVVVAVLMLSAGAALAQYGGYGAPGETAKPSVRAKVGWFEPSSSNLDGDVAFGLDYVIPYAQSSYVKRPYDLYVTVDRLHGKDTFAESTTWSLLAGINLMLQERFYAGVGIGAARETRETPFGDRDETRFAWEVGAGARLSGNGFAEVKYRDGGSDGNRGPVIYLGIAY